MKPNPPIKGHRLHGEGHIWLTWTDRYGGELFDEPRQVGGCECGAKPVGYPNVSVVAMKRWHRQHKAVLQWRTGMSDHLPGRNISHATYVKGCRCDDCKAAHAEENRTGASRAHVIANAEAAKWVRRHHPGVWAGLLDNAYRRLERPRRSVGRPKVET